MQTMSIVNKLKSSVFLTLAIVFQTLQAGAAEATITFQLEKKETICIGGTKSKDVGKCDQFVDSKSLDKGTRQILQRSDEVLPVFSQPNDTGYYLVLIARIPSKTPQSSGYCGAGYEDHLLLLAYGGKKIALRDDFLLQSCLKSIQLDSDGGDDILNAISIDRDKYLIGFRWLTNPDNRDHIVTISDSKFLLK